MSQRSLQMKNRPEPIHSFLNGGGTLNSLQEQSQRLLRLRENVRSCLPEVLARHLLACSVTDSQLILYTENASRATALRLATHKLLQKLNQNHGLGQITTIRVRIADISRLQQQAAHQPRPLPPGTADLVAELAETAVDPEIKKTLRRLARRSRSNKPLDQ